MTSTTNTTSGTIPTTLDANTAFDNEETPQNTQKRHPAFEADHRYAQNTYPGQAGDDTQAGYYTQDPQGRPAFAQTPYTGPAAGAPGIPSTPDAPGTTDIPRNDGGKRPWSHGKLVGVVAVVSLLCGLAGGVGGAFAVRAITGTQSGGTSSGQMGQPPSGGQGQNGQMGQPPSGGQAPNGQSQNGQSSNGSGSSGSDSSGSGSSSSGSSDSSSSSSSSSN